MGKLLFGRDMILPVKHAVDWELTSHQNQAKINKYNIRKNSKRVDHDYKVKDKVTINIDAAFKYEIPYKGTFEITQCCTNGMVMLKCGAIKIRYNIC